MLLVRDPLLGGRAEGSSSLVWTSWESNKEQWITHLSVGSSSSNPSPRADSSLGEGVVALERSRETHLTQSQSREN